MEKLKAVIIDDEIAAREVLLNLLNRYCPEIEVVAEANSLMNSVAPINLHQPDVVFCDIQMPQYAGYEITQFFDEINFHLVFVTAFDHYAIKAFEVSALDYLLKPIELDRLKSTIQKLVSSKEQTVAFEEYQALQQAISTNKVSRLTISEKGYRTFISFDDIVALEGQSAYCKIHLVDGTTKIISKNLKQTYSYFVDTPNFIRCHKSWGINLNHFSALSKSKLEVKLSTDLVAKISRNKITEMENQLSS
jgi:two-component system LytT family response regulator